MPPEAPRPLGPDGKPLPSAQQAQQELAKKRMAQQQAQVDEVVNIMRTNVEKVIERDEKLVGLDERAEALESGASQFEMHMGKLKSKFWKDNLKWVLVFVAFVLAVTLVVFMSNSSPEEQPPEAKARVSSPEEVLETIETAVAPGKSHHGIITDQGTIINENTIKNMTKNPENHMNKLDDMKA